MTGVFGHAASFVSSALFPSHEPLSAAQRNTLLDGIAHLQKGIESNIAALKLSMKTETNQTTLLEFLDSTKRALKTECIALLSVIPSAHKKEAEALLQPTKDALKVDLSTLPAQIKMVKKMRDQGFPQELAVTHPDFVNFIFTSKLAFWISCFRNSTEAGPANHGVKIGEAGEPLLKMNGEWQSWEQIQKLITYDEATERLVSKNDPSQSWVYISPQGLVQRDRFDYTEVYPVEEIGEAEYDRLLACAKEFYKTNEEQDKGQEKEAIYQVVTTYRTKWWGIEMPDNWMTKNALTALPRHITLRVIDKERKVYSFGFEMKKEEMDLVTSFFPPTILKTGTTYISVPDYEEPRPFKERTTTSVPMTSARAQKILDFVSHHNRQGVRFNYMKQNCTKLTGETLALAGYRVDTRLSFGDFFANLMPNVKDVPIIGSPVAWVAEKVMFVVRAILNAVITYTPSSIKQAVRYVPEKIATVLINLLILILGGARMTSPLPDGVEDERDNTTKLGRFSRIIRSPLDLFRDDICDLNYPQTIVDWQMKQKSTSVEEYDGKPQLNLIPKQVE